MFSRAAKSVVKNLGQRKCYVTDENIKVRVIGAAEELGQTLTQYAKNGPKLNIFPVSNSRPNAQLLMISAEKSQNLKAFEAEKVQDPRTESFPQKSPKKNNSGVTYFANRELDLEKTVTELRDKEIKLSSVNGLKKQSETSGQQKKITDFPLSEEKLGGQMWALGGIAAVKNDSSASQWRQLSQTRSEGLPHSTLTTQPMNAELTISGIPKVTSEAITAVKLWLGDPDCGECPPDRPLRSPCHPPDGPCVPLKKPGYPAKPKAPKKDFCFNCPPKRPCNLNKCPPDSCDGTCDNADARRPNLLKLNSESQASCDFRSTVEYRTIRLLFDTSSGNANQPDHIIRGLQQDASYSPKINPPDPPSRPNSTELQTFGNLHEAKVLYQENPGLTTFSQLSECPNSLEAKAEEICPTIISECPFLNELPKCPECKSHRNSAFKGSSTFERQAIKFLGTPTWIVNRTHHKQSNNICLSQRQFCSSSENSCDIRSTVEYQMIRLLDTSSGNANQPDHIIRGLQQDASYSPKINPLDPPSPSNSTELQTFGNLHEAKVSYQENPGLTKFSQLSECPNSLEAKAEEICTTIIPECPFLNELPKCPECKSYRNSASKGSSTFERQAIKFPGTPTWNVNRTHRNQSNNICLSQRQFCSSSDDSKPSKKRPPKVHKKCSDKPKPPEPPKPPKRPSRPKQTKVKAAEPAKASKGPKVVYQKCPPLPELPKLPKCPDVLTVPPKCPPLPKLPKLPKCPECQKLEEPKAKPQTSAKTSASSPDCQADQSVPITNKKSPTVKNTGDSDHPKESFCCSTVPTKVDEKVPKKKGLWDKIRDATKREMSTYTSNNSSLFKPTGLKNQKRHLWTCSHSCSSFSSKTDPPSSDSPPQWKSRKCKTVEEVCGEVVDPKLKALECKPVDCPKTENPPCYPEKPRCAGVRPPTYTSNNSNLLKPTGLKNQNRHLWTCSISCSSFSSKTDPPSSDSPAQWKSRKCKTVEEVCGEVVDPKLKALECKPVDCPKTGNPPCYPEKPRCAEVRPPTYTSNNSNLLKPTSLKNQKRHLWTCSLSCSSFSSKTDPPSSDSPPQWKSRKCKTVEEVCGEVVDPKLKALECKPVDCPKTENPPCYPEKPRCAEVRPPPVKKSEMDKMLLKQSSVDSGKNRSPSIVEPAEKIKYKKTECVQIKLLEAGPCPTSPINLKDFKAEKVVKASSNPLPKPPAPPVHLCRCAPPPKVHPGSCPCYEEPESTTFVLTDPCPAKKYSCPAPPVYICSPIKTNEKNDKVRQDNKKNTK